MTAVVEPSALKRKYESDDAAGRFAEETRALFVQRTKIGCWLAFTLIPAGTLLDYVSYPHLFYEILAARLLAAVTIVGIYLALFTAAGRKYVLALTAAWGFVPAFTIAWMIDLTDGGASPFYAGLNLVILGTCVLAPFTLRQSAVYCIGVFAIYVAACVGHGGLASVVAPFVANSIFIVMTSVICVTFSHFNDRLRRRDFQSRSEIERHNRELRTLDEMKTQFFANVSHELRTPLTLILAPLQELLRQPRDAGDVGLLTTIERSAQRLAKRIDDLLALVRFDADKLNAPDKAVFDANVTLRALGDAFGPVACERGVGLTVDLCTSVAPVLANADDFERAVLNLLSNAMKFTPAERSVCLRSRLTADSVVVVVADTGIGIASDDLPLLTRRFLQLDASETRRFPGLGLGLALVKEIVDSHGGTLDISSRLGEGTEVTLTFPRGRQTQASRYIPASTTPKPLDAPAYLDARTNGLSDARIEAPADASPSTTRRGTVLVADDEPELREFLRRSLESDYETIVAADGDEALRSALDFRPDVVVLDMMMPGRSGLDVCRHLRAEDQRRDCRILMLTARIDESLKVDALRAGADDFLFKPFDMAEVRARVGGLVQTAKLQRALRTSNDELRATLARLGETQAQLVQSEKMNALGGLAAGILHEFKNPLNHALLAISVARKTGAAAEPEIAADLEETLSDAEAALRRIDQIASDLRAFAHPEKADAVQSFLLAGTIADASRFLNAELADVRLDVEFDPRLQVACPRTHLVQLFVNLLSNAAAAVAETAERRSPRIVVSAERDDERVTIRVRDNGVGIPPERLTRIFEPFYTTKPVGAGTGLGLTVCHAIVARWEASLAVASEPDAWTEFSFEVPLADSGSVKKATA